jgi:hypothetical protein
MIGGRVFGLLIAGELSSHAIRSSASGSPVLFHD